MNSAKFFLKLTFRLRLKRCYFSFHYLNNQPPASNVQNLSHRDRKVVGMGITWPSLDIILQTPMFKF